jgi:oligopeptide transport system substrate-binding protein
MTLRNLFSSLWCLVISLSIYGAIPQTLNLGNQAEVRDLDPPLQVGVPESRILFQLFEGLVNKDPKTLKPTPGVAERWTVSKDGLVYTFYLRKNAKWSNGEEVTAPDFVYAITRLILPETAAEYAYYGYYVKNGKSVNSKLKPPSELGLKVIDPYTLQITLENPTPFFLGLLAHQTYAPAHKATIEKWGKAWTRPEHFVGNGAFTLTNWEVNKVITLKPNPYYWDKDKVKLSIANFYPTENYDTEEKMFRTGKLDITMNVPIEKIPFWKKDSTGVFHSDPWLGAYYYLFNHKKRPTDDIRVRKALTLAVDRERIVNLVTRGNQDPALSFVPPGTGGYFPKPILNPRVDAKSLAEAKRLLAEYVRDLKGEPFPKIEIMYNTSEEHKKVAEAVQAMWKQNLGVDATLVNVEWKVFLDNHKTGNYIVCRKGWIADYNDPTTFLDLYMTNSGGNGTGWGNTVYDGALASAAKELDLKKRLTFFQKAESVMMDELPVLPVYIWKRNYLMSKKVKGWYPNVEDLHYLKDVSITP